MKKMQNKKHRKPYDDTGEQVFKEGKIGSGYMSTFLGQPALRDTVEMTAKKDFEIRPRETKQ